MGLFSFLNKNKQDRSTEDSGRFVRPEDEAPSERARRRAAHGAEGGRRKAPADPVLPEKKRARRRLVGAIALALAAAVGLPMLLDSEPKPLAGDIAIQIPSQDKAAPLPLPLPSEPVTVAAADAVDSDEEIIEPPAADRREVDAAAPAKATPAPVHAVRTEPKPDMARYEPVKTAPEPKATPKPEPKVAEAKPADKPAPKAPAKPEEKPAARPQPAQDAARALAILEGKQAAARGILRRRPPPSRKKSRPRVPSRRRMPRAPSRSWKASRPPRASKRAPSASWCRSRHWRARRRSPSCRHACAGPASRPLPRSRPPRRAS
jgi:DedD protein